MASEEHDQAVDDFLRGGLEGRLEGEIEALEMELEAKREELELVQQWKAIRSAPEAG